MPSMPESVSSSTLVTWVSTIGGAGAGILVSTVITGGSMAGYSRTLSRS